MYSLKALLAFALPLAIEPVLANPVTALALGARAASATCTPTPIVPPPQGYVCNQQGTVAGLAGHNIFTSCTNSYVGCYETCLSIAACQAFSYQKSKNRCVTYTKSIQHNGFTSSKSGVVFCNMNHCFKANKACKYNCLSPPTSSTPPTTTTTSTTTSPTTTPTTSPTLTIANCGNQGIQWAIWPNYQGDDNDPTYSQFDPTVYKSIEPDHISTSSSIGGFNQPNSNQQMSLYGDPYTFSSNYFVLNHRGYFYPTISGVYILSITNTNKLAMVWFGSSAYSGWVAENSFDVPYDTRQQQPGSESIPYEMTAGQYYAFRIIFAQAQGPASSFGFAITDPNGKLVVDSTSQPSDQVVQFSCDGTSAPAYPPFGSET